MFGSQKYIADKDPLYRKIGNTPWGNDILGFAVSWDKNQSAKPI